MEVYAKIAEAYSAAYGEPLVADEDWVLPIYLMCEAAVLNDPTTEDLTTATADAIVERTVEVIATITYGTKAERPAPAQVSA